MAPTAISGCLKEPRKPSIIATPITASFAKPAGGEAIKLSAESRHEDDAGHEFYPRGLGLGQNTVVWICHAIPIFLGKLTCFNIG